MPAWRLLPTACAGAAGQTIAWPTQQQTARPRQRAATNPAPARHAKPALPRPVSYITLSSTTAVPQQALPVAPSANHAAALHGDIAFAACILQHDTCDALPASRKPAAHMSKCRLGHAWPAHRHCRAFTLQSPWRNAAEATRILGPRTRPDVRRHALKIIKTPGAQQTIIVIA